MSDPGFLSPTPRTRSGRPYARTINRSVLELLGAGSPLSRRTNRFADSPASPYVGANPTSSATSDESTLSSSPLFIPPKSPQRKPPSPVPDYDIPSDVNLPGLFSPRSDSSDSETKDFSSPRSSLSEPPVADYEDREEASSSNPITAGFISLKNSLLTGPIAMSARNWFDDLTAFLLGAEYKPKPLQVKEDDIVSTPIGNYVKVGDDWIPLSKTWDKPWDNKMKRVGYVENAEGKSYEILLPTKKDIDFIELDSFRLPVNQMHRQYKHIPYSNYGGKINVRDEGKPGYLKRIRNAAIRQQGGKLKKFRKGSTKVKMAKDMDFDFE